MQGIRCTAGHRVGQQWEGDGGEIAGSCQSRDQKLAVGVLEKTWTCVAAAFRLTRNEDRRDAAREVLAENRRLKTSRRSRAPPRSAPRLLVKAS